MVATHAFVGHGADVFLKVGVRELASVECAVARQLVHHEQAYDVVELLRAVHEVGQGTELHVAIEFDLLEAQVGFDQLALVALVELGALRAELKVPSPRREELRTRRVVVDCKVVATRASRR